MICKCVALALVVAAVWARTTSTLQTSSKAMGLLGDGFGNYIGGLGYVYEVYRECAAGDTSTCLKLKVIEAMDRADRAYPVVKLSDSVSFVRESNPISYVPPKSEAEIEAALPRNADAKDEALNSLIVEKVANFFSTHTLQIKLPIASDLKRSFVEEGRKKKNKDKDSHLTLIPMLLGGTLIPLAIVGLALFAGKALLVSVLALVLAGILGLRRILSGSSGGGPETGHKVVVAADPVHDPYNYGRSLDKEEAQKLAYNSYSSQAR